MFAFHSGCIAQISRISPEKVDVSRLLRCLSSDLKSLQLLCLTLMLYLYRWEMQQCRSEQSGIVIDSRQDTRLIYALQRGVLMLVPSVPFHTGGELSSTWDTKTDLPVKATQRGLS